jgi:hypothetical protein
METTSPRPKPFDVDVPASGDFSLDITNIPPDADWINGLPKMRVIVGGETLTPDQSFSATPYALVARNVENLDTSKVKLAGTDGDLLSSWQDPKEKSKISANVIVGTVPYVVPDNISALKIDGTAIVQSTTITQTIQPTQPVVPLIVKGQPNTSPNLNMFEVWDNAAVPSKQFHIQGFGTAYFKGKVGIGTQEPSDQLEVVGNIRMLNGNRQILFNDTGNYDFSIVHNGGTSLDIRSPELDLTIASFSNNGNVGIGTWTPSAKLEVAGGDMKVGGSITLLNDLRIKREGAVPAQYDFQILPIMTNDKSDLQILPDAPETGIGIYTRNSAGTAKLGLGINKDGYVGVNKTDPTKPLDVAGDANITGNLGVTGTINSGYVNVSGAASVGTLASIGNLHVDGGTNLATVSGNVGIGTNSPSAKLDVNGPIKFTSQKMCRATTPGLFTWSTLVPSSWTSGTCASFAATALASQFQLGCIFENSFSLGSANGGIPSPNCGW